VSRNSSVLPIRTRETRSEATRFALFESGRAHFHRHRNDERSESSVSVKWLTRIRAQRTSEAKSARFESGRAHPTFSSVTPFSRKKIPKRSRSKE